MHKINSSGATRNVGINYLTFVNQNILSNVLLMLYHLLYRQRRFFPATSIVNLSELTAAV